MNRRVFLFLALAGLIALWCGPLPAQAKISFAAHMTLHMGIVAVVAPFLAFGIAGSRFDPVRHAPKFFPPVPLSLLELVAVWTWHAPALHRFARQDTIGFVAEQGTFIVAGLLVWLSAFGGGRLQAAERKGAGIVALLLTSMHMTLLGALLALTPRALYWHAEVCALSPLDDQQLGGAIMLIVGGVAYLLGGAWLITQLLRRSHSEAVA